MRESRSRGSVRGALGNGRPYRDVRQAKLASSRGKTADEAYVIAGYKENHGNAGRLKANETIWARVAEIVDRGAIRAEITMQTLLDELEEARALAKKEGQAAAMVSATREKAVLTGHRIERAEKGKPGEFSELSDEELARRISEVSIPRQSRGL